MNGKVDVLAVLDVDRDLGVKQSTKNANAGFVDFRDWCAFVGKAAEARAALAELIDVYEELLSELGEISDEAGQEPYNNPRANAALARVKGE